MLQGGCWPGLRAGCPGREEKWEMAKREIQPRGSVMCCCDMSAWRAEGLGEMVVRPCRGRAHRGRVLLGHGLWGGGVQLKAWVVHARLRAAKGR